MKQGSNRVLLTTLLVLSLVGGLWADGNGFWLDLAPMPSRRQEVSTAALNGEIFVIAGFNSGGGSTNTVEVYDFATDTWRTAASFPIATNHNAAAVAAGFLYAFGGTSNRVFFYYPEKDAWYEVASMNYQHGNTPAVAVINDYILVAGGTGPGMVGNEVEIYDPFKDIWTVLAPMNVPRNHTAGGAIDGLFYVAGGRGSAGSAAALEVYDITTNTWTVLPSMPTGRSGVAAAAVNGCLYVFGGEQPRIFNEVEVYNPQTGAWRQLPPMNPGRHGIFAAVIENWVFIPGGATVQGFGATDINQVFIVE